MDIFFSGKEQRAVIKEQRCRLRSFYVRWTNVTLRIKMDINVRRRQGLFYGWKKDCPWRKNGIFREAKTLAKVEI